MRNRLPGAVFALVVSQFLANSALAGADGNFSNSNRFRGYHPEGALKPAALGPRMVAVDCAKGASLQRGIDRALPGDLILVAGLCRESVLIVRNRVVLQCIAGGRLFGIKGATIEVRGKYVVVAGCAVTGGGAGIRVANGGSAVLIGNKISGARTGIDISGNSYGRLIDGNRVTGNVTGIMVRQGSGADIIDTVINDNTGAGLVVTRAAAADIVGNRITGNGASGVTITDSSAAQFSDDTVFGREANEISGNGAKGIFCGDVSAVTFGAAQKFGAGNPGGNFDSSGGGFCAVAGKP